MSSVLWAHDHIFVHLPGGEVASEGKLPASVWDRYLVAFDRVIVCARGRTLGAAEDRARLSVSSRPEVEIRRLPNLSRVGALLATPAEAVATLESAVEAADGVIARLPSEAGLLALEIASRMQRPAAVEVVGCPWDALRTSSRLAARLYAPVAFWRMRRAVRRASHALYVTQSFLQRRYPCQGVTIGCSDVQLEPVSDQILVRRRERRVAGRPVLGVIGSLSTNVKGVDTAIRALARGIPGPRSPVLRIVGGGDPSEYQLLAKHLGVGDSVFFDGTLPSGAAINEWLGTIDVYLQPSRTEGIPRSLIEAMAQGCPVIASAVGGIPELLDAECLHLPRDSEGLCRLIDIAVNSSEWRANQSDRNFAVAAHFRSDVLDPRRTAFWQRFAEFAKATGRQA